MSLGPNERKTLSSLLENLVNHAIEPEIRRSKHGNEYLVLKSRSTGRILCQTDLDSLFDSNGNYFQRDVGA